MDRWQKSSWKQADGTAGEFKLTAGKWYGDAEEDKGIQTGPDSKFFATYAEMAKAVDTTGKDLVLQVRTRSPRAPQPACLVPCLPCRHLTQFLCRARSSP